MKNFPDKPRSGCCLRFAGAVAALTLLMSMPAAAQQYSAENADQGPVDLLATIQDNASNDSDKITYGVTDNSSAAAITSIDDAVNSVTELPVLEVPATSEPTQPSAMAQTATDGTAVMVTGDVGEAPADDSGAPETQGVTGEIGAPAAVADGNAASTGASLQKSSAPVFGIANIGVETETGLSVTIWRNTTADRAARPGQ